MFISLRKYLDGRPEQLANALLQMVRLLLETIERHAVKGDAGDYETFRNEIRGVREGFGEDPAPQDVLVTAGRVVKALEQYNTSTTRFLQVQCSELQTIIAMLTKTMTALATGSENAVSRLQEIEQQLHKAALIEDFQTAKARMAECLDGIRHEIVRQREESSCRVTELRTVVERSQERTVARTNREVRTDPLTGLPERAAAEAALSAAVREGRPVYAAVFVIERLDLINSRFGHEAGDQVLVFFRAQVAQGLSRSDRLFRWTGPAFLAVLDRPDPVHKIREQLSRTISNRLSKNITVANRTVLLPIHANWMVFPAHELRPFSQLLRNIDSFVHGIEPAKAAAV